MAHHYEPNKPGQRRGWLEERLQEIEQKLEHIIYRLEEEDPRSYRYRIHRQRGNHHGMHPNGTHDARQQDR